MLSEGLCRNTVSQLLSFALDKGSIKSLTQISCFKLSLSIFVKIKVDYFHNLKISTLLSNSFMEESNLRMVFFVFVFVFGLLNLNSKYGICMIGTALENERTTVCLK